MALAQMALAALAVVIVVTGAALGFSALRDYIQTDWIYIITCFGIVCFALSLCLFLPILCDIEPPDIPVGWWLGPRRRPAAARQRLEAENERLQADNTRLQAENARLRSAQPSVPGAVGRQ